MICKHILLITLLKEPNTFCTQLKGLNYCYIAVTILHKSFLVLSLLFAL